MGQSLFDRFPYGLLYTGPGSDFKTTGTPVYGDPYVRALFPYFEQSNQLTIDANYKQGICPSDPRGEVIYQGNVGSISQHYGLYWYVPLDKNSYTD